jgi:mono/diheme cytochrome c family protein
MRSRIACLGTILVLAISVSLAAQTSPIATSPATSQSGPSQIKKLPAPYTNPSSGKDMYIAYCASCHGKDGMGNGPAAPALKTRATDLTLLAVKNGGKFPDSHIAEVIKGDNLTAAHGNKEMPVWGPVFLALGRHDTAQAQMRIHNLTTYLESIQQK